MRSNSGFSVITTRSLTQDPRNIEDLSSHAIHSVHVHIHVYNVQCIHVFIHVHVLLSETMLQSY